MRANWQYFILAFLMASSLWFMVSGREEVEAWVRMRIEMKGMPPDLIVMSGLEPQVDIRVRAPKGLLRSLSERPLAYSLNLSALTPGENVIPVHPEQIPLGSAYKVVEVRPSRLTLEVDSIETREVPVTVKPQGELAVDMKIIDAKPVPETVLVRGASSLVKTVESVVVPVTVPTSTEPGLTEVSSPVSVPDGLEAAPAQVRVAFTLGLKTVNKSVVREVEIVEPDGVSVKARSRKVTLQLELPESRSGDDAVLDEVRAELDVPQNIEPGTHALPYRVHLPDGVWLKSAKPNTLTVTIRK